MSFFRSLRSRSVFSVCRLVSRRRHGISTVPRLSLTPAMRPLVNQQSETDLPKNFWISLLFVLEAPDMYAIQYLWAAQSSYVGPCPPDQGRTRPNREISLLFNVAFLGVWSTICTHGSVSRNQDVKFSGSDATSLLRSSLPGSRPATSVSTQARGVVALSTAPSSLFLCLAEKAGAVSFSFSSYRRRDSRTVLVGMLRQSH